jgi:hypothetical protein
MSAAIMDRFVNNLDRHPVETQIEKVKERISTLQEQLDAHAARSVGSKAPVACQEFQPQQCTSHDPMELAPAVSHIDTPTAVAFACEAPTFACGAPPAAKLPQLTHNEDIFDPVAACGTSRTAVHYRAGDGAAVRTCSSEAIACSAACNISITGKHASTAPRASFEHGGGAVPRALSSPFNLPIPRLYSLPLHPLNNSMSPHHSPISSSLHSSPHP